MPSYVYIVVQSDFESLDDEEILKADVEIISCHTTLDAANGAAKDWVIEACGGDDDEPGYDDFQDNTHGLAHECFDTTFYLSPHDDRYSIRIQVVKKKLRGPLLPGSASSGSKTASKPRPESSINELRGPVRREFEDEDCQKEDRVVVEPAAKRQKM